MPRRWVGIASLWTDTFGEGEGFEEEFVPVLVTGSMRQASRRGQSKAVNQATGWNPSFNRWEFFRSESQYRKDMRDRERLMTGKRQPERTEEPLEEGGRLRWKHEAYWKKYGPTMVWMLREDDRQRAEIARQKAAGTYVSPSAQKRGPYRYESRADEDEARIERAQKRQEKAYDRWLAEQQNELPDVPAKWYWEE